MNRSLYGEWRWRMNLSTVSETDSIDIVGAYAIQLPEGVLARVLGIPSEDYLRFKRWSDGFLAVVTKDKDPAQRAASAREMMAHLGKMAAARGTCGADDLITALVEAERHAWRTKKEPSG